MRYTARPIEIQAWLWAGAPDDLPEWEWSTGLYQLQPDGTLIIQTLEGPSRAIPNLHYAVVGTKNERYPVRRDIFEEKYEAVGE